MTSDIRLPITILSEVCRKNDLDFSVIDSFSKSIVKVSRGDQHFLAGLGKVGMYPLNAHYSASVAGDKAWTYQLLTRAGFIVPSGDYFFVTNDWAEFRSEGKDIESAVVFAAKLGYPVFVKPNDASSGVLAELITDERGLRDHLQRIALKSPIALVQQYLDFPEYRLFVVDGEVQYLYRREKPKVIGDGKLSIIELIEKMNRDIPIASHRIDAQTDYLKTQLQQQNVQLQNILPLGESLFVAAHANLASGGELLEYTESVPSQVHEFAATISNELGLRVAGIDVFIPGSLTTEISTKNWTIIEVNSNPNLAGIYTHNHQEKALEIWKKIIFKFFNKD